VTEAEFDGGWAFLLAQPFAYLYQRDAAAEAVQRRLYFEKLRRSDGAAWLKVATNFACGSKWPSLDEIQSSLRNAQPKPRQIEDQRPHEQPEVIGKIVEYAKTSGSGFIVAMRAVLPGWIEAHPQDELASGMLARMGTPPVENHERSPRDLRNRDATDAR
jgi:hypothetical protein